MSFRERRFVGAQDCLVRQAVLIAIKAIELRLHVPGYTPLASKGKWPEMLARWRLQILPIKGKKLGYIVVVRMPNHGPKTSESTSVLHQQHHLSHYSSVQKYIIPRWLMDLGKGRLRSLHHAFPSLARRAFRYPRHCHRPPSLMGGRSHHWATDARCRT